MQNMGAFVIDLVGTTSTDGGAIAAVANPEGQKLIITEAYVIVDTPSTGAANLNAGVAANATTSDTDLVNALAINGSITGNVYNGPAPAAKAAVGTWGATEYITASGSADSTGFRGRLFVKYIRTVDGED
jgi:phage gp45-like